MVASALRYAALGGACAFIVLGTAVACSSSSGGSDRQNTDSDANKDPEPIFRALQSDLVRACGGANGQCHVQGTYQSAPRWLADPDPYLSAKKYRGIVPVTHETGDSILLSQVRHEGPALADIKPANTSDRTLYDRVAEWITAEAPPPPLPNTGAFSVREGFNLVHLDTVASGLTGASLTFLATDQNQVLTLSALKIQAPSNANIHITSPFFVILPRTGKVNADPDVNGFKGELTVKAGTTVDLFLGKMILLRWDSNGQLKIVFSAIEGTPGQGASTSCTALDTFNSKAVPALNAKVDIIDPDEGDGGSGGGDGGAVIGQGSCVGCHGDTAPTPQYPAAVNAMDLRDIGTDPGKACVNARTWINFAMPAQSTILLNPQGQANPKHPMKPVSASDPIVTGLSAWVTAEKP